MFLVAIAWIYVVLLMAVAEATSPSGTLLGALAIVLFYGVLPLALVIYVARARRRRTQRAAASAPGPDRSRHAPGDAIAPEREEP